MQLGLRAKLTMVMTGLVLLSSLVLSMVFLELLLQQVLHDTNMRAKELAHEVFDSAKQAGEDAKAQGLRPQSDDPQKLHEYVQRAFEMSDSLSSRLQAAGTSPAVREVKIIDSDGVVLISYPILVRRKNCAAARSVRTIGPRFLPKAGQSLGSLDAARTHLRRRSSIPLAR